MRREAQLIPSDLTREPKPYSASVLDSRSSGKRNYGNASQQARQTEFRGLTEPHLEVWRACRFIQI